MFPEEVENKIIFVAPLDWGLGHATRCVPIIKKLLNNNNQVVLGLTSLTSKILEKEFPHLKKVFLPEYNISYSTILPLWLKLLFHYPSFKRTIKKEKEALKKIIIENHINLIISDNRYGLVHPKMDAVIICHQINLKTPFLNYYINKVHLKLLKNFTEVWVPDYEDKTKRLSGELGENAFNLKLKYIGPQSRFCLQNVSKKYDLLFLLSGPEPFQENLLNRIINFLPELTENNIAIVTSSKDKLVKNKNVTVFYLPELKILNEIICSSELIICRSGYSTLMDLYTLEKKNIILVPTKGQTEQEYLAEYWNTKFGTIVAKENNLLACLKSIQ